MLSAGRAKSRSESSIVPVTTMRGAAANAAKVEKSPVHSLENYAFWRSAWRVGRVNGVCGGEKQGEDDRCRLDGTYRGPERASSEAEVGQQEQRLAPQEPAGYWGRRASFTVTWRSGPPWAGGA